MSTVIEAARRVVRHSTYGWITTGPVDADPPVTTRVVQRLEVTADLEIAFGTSPRTRKAEEIRSNPHVVWSSLDPDRGAAVAVYGTARLNEDPARARALWRDDLLAYFPGGATGGDFVVVEIEPTRAEVWSFADGIHPLPMGLSSAVAVRSDGVWADAPDTFPDG